LETKQLPTVVSSLPTSVDTADLYMLNLLQQDLIDKKTPKVVSEIIKTSSAERIYCHYG
jgi:hypothetical protein